MNNELMLTKFSSPVVVMNFPFHFVSISTVWTNFTSVHILHIINLKKIQNNTLICFLNQTKKIAVLVDLC